MCVCPSTLKCFIRCSKCSSLSLAPIVSWSSAPMGPPPPPILLLLPRRYNDDNDNDDNDNDDNDNDDDDGNIDF